MKTSVVLVTHNKTIETTVKVKVNKIPIAEQILTFFRREDITIFAISFFPHSNYISISSQMEANLSF
jgi:hypothetical protein